MKNFYTHFEHSGNCQCDECTERRNTPEPIKYRAYDTKTLNMTIQTIEFSGGSWIVHFSVKSKFDPKLAVIKDWHYVDKMDWMTVENWNKYATLWHDPVYRKAQGAK